MTFLQKVPHGSALTLQSNGSRSRSLSFDSPEPLCSSDVLNLLLVESFSLFVVYTIKFLDATMLNHSLRLTHFLLQLLSATSGTLADRACEPSASKTNTLIMLLSTLGGIKLPSRQNPKEMYKDPQNINNEDY